MSGIESDRHRQRQRGGRHTSSLHSRECVPGRPLQRCSDEPGRWSCRPSRAPMTSATSSCAPLSTSTRPRPRSARFRIPSRRTSKGSHAPALDPDQPGPARLHAQPDQLRPVQRRHARLRRPGAASTGPSHFQVSSCPDLGFAPRIGLKLTGSMKRRGHPALTATGPPLPGKRTSAAPGDHAQERAPRQRPHPHHLHAGPVRCACLPERFGVWHGDSGDTVARQTADRSGLPPRFRQPSTRLGRGPSGTDRGRIGRTDRHREERGPARAIQHGAGCSGLVLRSRLDGGKKGLLINSANLCGARPKASVTLVGQNGVQNSRSRSCRRAVAPRRLSRSGTRRKTSNG